MRTAEADLTICRVDYHKDPLIIAATQIGQRIGVLFRIHKLDFALALQRRVGLPDGDQPPDLMVQGVFVHHLGSGGGAVGALVLPDVQLLLRRGGEARIHCAVPLHGRAGAGAVVAAFHRGDVLNVAHTDLIAIVGKRRAAHQVHQRLGKLGTLRRAARLQAAHSTARIMIADEGRNQMIPQRFLHLLHKTDVLLRRPGSGADDPGNVPLRLRSRKQKEAVDAAFAAYCKEYKDAIYCIGSVVGPHPFPMMVRDFQSIVGIEAREQFLDMTGELPDAVVACVGGGSNAMGLFSGFLNDPVDIYGVEPLGRGIKMGDHAASLTYGEEGIMHGFNSIMLKDENGDPAPVYSVASGLDYPSCGPEHAFLHDLGRVKYDVVTDDETINAFFELSRMEGIIPAIESSHAVAYGMKLAKSMGKGSVLINLSGRGDKDMDYIIEKYGIR